MNTKWLYVTIIPKYTLDLELQTVDIKKLFMSAMLLFTLKKVKQLISKETQLLIDIYSRHVKPNFIVPLW